MFEVAAEIVSAAARRDSVMLRFLKGFFRGLLNFGQALTHDGMSLFGWLFRVGWEGWTGRSLDAEAAEAREAEAAQTSRDASNRATAADRAEARADRLRQLIATREVLDELRRQEAAREHHRALGRAHDLAQEVSAHDWLHLPSADEDAVPRLA